VGETIHGGGHLRSEAWGGLPILLLFGDDYQLQGFGEGAFQALCDRNRSNIAMKGRQAFLDCTEIVMELKASIRMQDDKIQDKQLLDRLRVATDVTERDVQKLMSLRMDVMEAKHGKAVVAKIQDEAMHLFYRNAKRICHNLQKLVEKSSPTNPVAVIRAVSKGPNGKGISRHFDSDTPNSSLICKNAKVAIECRNLVPIWGLHNGACGTVVDIIFNEGENPNHGDHPKYVCVHFPLCCGPVWDIDNPKARSSKSHYDCTQG